MDIPFRGGSYEGHFILGDVKLSWPWEYGVVRTFVSQKGVMACFPMRGHNRYRVILIPKSASSTNESDISLHELSTIARELSTPGLQLSEPVWLTRFRVSHRLARSFRKGNAFLAGDAAHIHSPAGGQGMNTGIQDAFNLGAKLIRVLRNEAGSQILGQYEYERLPIAKKVLRGTDLVFRLALLPENFLVGTLRSFLMPKIVGNRAIQNKVAAAISEVAISRRERQDRTELFHSQNV